MAQRLILLLTLFLLPLYLLTGEASRIEKKLDALLVYGEGFVFSVKEPAGWVGDIEDAKQYSANINHFLPSGENSRFHSNIHSSVDRGQSGR